MSTMLVNMILQYGQYFFFQRELKYHGVSINNKVSHDITAKGIGKEYD